MIFKNKKYKILHFNNGNPFGMGFRELKILSRNDGGFDCFVGDGFIYNSTYCGNLKTLINFVRMARGLL